MRRWLILLGAAILVPLIGGIGFLIWAMTGPGLLDTARITTDPAEVANLAAADLGLAALPAGVRGIGAREDGFQDRIVWVRLEADTTGFDALLAALRLSRSDLGLDQSNGAPPVFQHFDDAAWWRAPDPAGVTGATELAAPFLAHLRMTAIEDGQTGGLWHIYLRGNET